MVPSTWHQVNPVNNKIRGGSEEGVLIYMYLNTRFTLFYGFGQIRIDTLCLHNNTSKLPVTTRHLVPGAWYLVPDTRYLELAAWYHGPGTWYLVPVTWYLILAPMEEGKNK